MGGTSSIFWQQSLFWWSVNRAQFCGVSSCFASHLGFAGACLFFPSERFGRSLKDRTHKNEMECCRELSIHFFMRDCWNG